MVPELGLAFPEVLFPHTEADGGRQAGTSGPLHAAPFRTTWASSWPDGWVPRRQVASEEAESVRVPESGRRWCRGWRDGAGRGVRVPGDTASVLGVDRSSGEGLHERERT